jgi:hypothetical protein
MRRAAFIRRTHSRPVASKADRDTWSDFLQVGDQWIDLVIEN